MEHKALRISEAEHRRRYETFLQEGSYTKAAKVLGIDESRVRASAKHSVRKNQSGDFLGREMPEGYILGKVTSLVGPDGTVMEWQHRLPEAEALEARMDALIARAQAEVRPLPEIAKPPLATLGQLTLYPVADAHLGQYSWHKESGENYDLDIAARQFRAATGELLALTPPSSEAMVVILGDYYHADNNMAETAKSHNKLDVDGRHDKVLHLGAELAMDMIDMALQKHDHVMVKVMRGNHDPNASKALTMTLFFRYEGNPRVTVNRDPQDLWAYEFGSNMLAFTHGDNVKAEDMPGVMAAHYPDMWGRTKWRFGFSGHYHRRKTGPMSDEKHGAEWEILPAFTAKDAWNRQMGHASKRGLQAITFDQTEGRKFTTYVTIK